MTVTLHPADHNKKTAMRQHSTPKAPCNISVFNAFQKTVTVGANLISKGRLFQTVGVATEKHHLLASASLSHLIKKKTTYKCI